MRLTGVATTMASRAGPAPGSETRYETCKEFARPRHIQCLNEDKTPRLLRQPAKTAANQTEHGTDGNSPSQHQSPFYFAPRVCPASCHTMHRFPAFGPVYTTFKPSKPPLE